MHQLMNKYVLTKQIQETLNSQATTNYHLKLHSHFPLHKSYLRIFIFWKWWVLLHSLIQG